EGPRCLRRMRPTCRPRGGCHRARPRRACRSRRARSRRMADGRLDQRLEAFGERTTVHRGLESLLLAGESRLALDQRPFRVAQLRGVEEIAHDAGPAVRKLDSVDFPLVSLDLVDVGARVHEVLRAVRLAAVERAPEHREDLGRYRLGPQDSYGLVERPADHRAYVAERDVLRYRVHVRDAEIGVHDIDAERHLLDELDECRFAYAERAVRTMRTDRPLPAVVH